MSLSSPSSANKPWFQRSPVGGSLITIVPTVGDQPPRQADRDLRWTEAPGGDDIESRLDADLDRVRHDGGVGFTHPHMLVPEPPYRVLQEVGSLLASVDEHDRAMRQQIGEHQPRQPTAAAEIDQPCAVSERAERGCERSRMLCRLLDGSCAEESEALRFAQHLERLGPHLTPG